jgi:hypothetical protein
MRTIRMMLVDEAGNVVSGSERDYMLESSCKAIDEIEGDVERVAREALPELERVLLVEAQMQWAAEEKKGDCSVKARKNADKNTARHLCVGAGALGRCRRQGSALPLCNQAMPGKPEAGGVLSLLLHSNKL